MSLRQSILIMLVTTESGVQGPASLLTLQFLHPLRAIPILLRRGKHAWKYYHVFLGRLRIVISYKPPLVVIGIPSSRPRACSLPSVNTEDPTDSLVPSLHNNQTRHLSVVSCVDQSISSSCYSSTYYLSQSSRFQVLFYKALLVQTAGLESIRGVHDMTVSWILIAAGTTPEVRGLCKRRLESPCSSSCCREAR